jgi:hypothetical protein
MFKLDDQFLVSVGLGDMPEEQKGPFLEHLLEELELRVGTRLSEGMSDSELTEFEKLIETHDEPGALRWLKYHRPDYQAVVSEELEKLKTEITANRDKVLG